MAYIGKLYSYMPNARVLKIQAAARLNNVSLDIPTDFQFGITNKTPEFRAKFPAGKVPAFEAADDGPYIAESDAIAQFVASSGPQATILLGSTAVEQAQIRQWICFAENEVYGHMLSVVLWRVGYQPYNPDNETRGGKALRDALEIVETHLSREKGFLVCGRLTLADLSLASALYWAFMHYLDEQLRGEIPQTVQWYKRTIEEEGVREVFGEPNLVSVRRMPEEFVA
ncbi:uncharacterized protein N7479_001517 [Penicillium vulpinum]|uniref:GST C-terminal domain-containing protein n=1 Tax=Penicillium vulpinum TaxID=29845 RepID=A0A1V6RUG8_9EURO|nr:uncharacterized protein N7479_001517 [Penicillium vulpinum]KAJ5971599.1 hypothetical protein N7479_001517 [Penicillium vulpinum]OQE05415.1 hypothetical protein PENVUL_c024G07592 [Penicillium vulpinum]